MTATLLYGFLVVVVFQVIQMWRWRILVAFVAGGLVAAVGLSRMYLGAHYLSDVLAAIAAGVVWLLLRLSALETLRYRRARRRQRDMGAARGLSPVLMTAAAAPLGLLPLLSGDAAGKELERPMVQRLGESGIAGMWSRLTQAVARGHHAAMHLSQLLGLLLIVVIGALAPATFADPPDPTWCGGFWDDDDLDDVVILLYGTTAAVEPIAVRAAPPVATVVVVECSEPVAVPAVVDETAAPRAPPLTVSAS